MEMQLTEASPLEGSNRVTRNRIQDQNSGRQAHGSWVVNSICRRVRLTYEALLWGCTSSQFKIKHAKFMPSSFSRAQSGFVVPKAIQQNLDQLREPKPDLRLRVEKLKFKFKLMSPFRGYCYPKLCADTVKSKAEAVVNEIRHERVSNPISSWSSECDKRMNKFIENFIISRASSRGEDVYSIKMWLFGICCPQDDWVEDVAVAKELAEKALDAAYDHVENSINSFEIPEESESVSPLEYSKFMRPLNEFISESRIKNRVLGILDSELNVLLDKQSRDSTPPDASS